MPSKQLFKEVILRQEKEKEDLRAHSFLGSMYMML
jgi:hypothetical protein